MWCYRSPFFRCHVEQTNHRMDYLSLIYKQFAIQQQKWSMALGFLENIEANIRKACTIMFFGKCKRWTTPTKVKWYWRKREKKLGWRESHNTSEATVIVLTLKLWNSYSTHESYAIQCGFHSSFFYFHQIFRCSTCWIGKLNFFSSFEVGFAKQKEFST